MKKSLLFKPIVSLKQFKRTILIMKLTTLMLFLCAFQLLATNGRAQDAVIKLKNTTLNIGELFAAIERQTNYLMVYNSEEVNLAERVSVKEKKQTVADCLNEILEENNLSYEFSNDYIILSKKDGVKVVPPVVLSEVRQTGVVTDQHGEPIIGASVLVKGTTIGTITDLNGGFTVSATKGATLEISYIGYITQEVVCTGKQLKVTLKEDTQSLDEVVVVGFGSQKKVNLTGSVSMVDDKVFASRPVSNATQMLQGTIPGLNITGGNGTSMNDANKINVRGIATIGEGSTGAPLILIDGMEGDLNSVNPQDIENVSVLKDAASSSIYGSRAPFGVILITTKSGSAGRVVVNYNNNFRWASANNLPTPMNSYEYALYLRDADANGGKASAIFTPDKIDMIKRRMEGEDLPSLLLLPDNPNRFGDGIGYGIANENHYDLTFKDNVFSHDHNFSIKGGNERVDYYVSVNYSDEKGLLRFNQESRRRITSTRKLSAKLTDWVTLKVTNRFTTQKFSEPIGKDSYKNFWKRLAMWPNNPLYDPNGNMVDGTPAAHMANEGTSTTNQKWFYQQYQIELEPIKNWKTFIDFNYRYTNTESKDVRKLFYIKAVDNKTTYLAKAASSDAYVQEERDSDYYINFNAYTQYSKTFKEKHNFKIMAGFQLEQQKLGDITARRDGLIMDTSASLDVTSGLSYDGKTVVPTVGGKYNDWAIAGFFGRLNYDYRGRYLAEVNMRYDGTSRFRKGNRWGFFPSVSLGWNIAREGFFENFVDVMGNLKLRASYGELGNQNTSGYYPTYRIVPVKVTSGNWLVNGAQPTISSEPALIDPMLTWETIKNWNFGVDISMLSNRLTGSFDYYIRDTKNMVGPAPELPDVFGFGVPKQNNTNLRTMGFELMLSWRDVKNGFSYGLTATLADSRTKITAYPNDTKSLSTYRTGQWMGEIWGFETIGIAKTDEEMNQHLASLPNGGQNNLGSKWAAGDIMYRDLDGDGKISKGEGTADAPGDMKIIGNDLPRYAFGLTLDAAWKGVDVRAFFQGVLKRDYFIESSSSDKYLSRMMWGACGTIYNSVGLANHLDYFRNAEDHELGQNLDAYYPRPLFDNKLKNQQTQTRYLEDASYVRLKNLQLGYTLPVGLVSKWGISNLRVYVSGENLFTLTKLSDTFDPETIDAGVGGLAYPISRTWSVGLNVSF